MGCCFCVQEDEVGVVERFGEFHSLSKPGCHWSIPCFTEVGRESLRVRYFESTVDTQTKDPVRVKLVVVVQYRVKSDTDTVPQALDDSQGSVAQDDLVANVNMSDPTGSNVYRAHYQAENMESVLSSNVMNAFRSVTTAHLLSALFTEFSTLVRDVQDQVQETVSDFGLEIVSIQMKDLQLPSGTRRLYATQRLASISKHVAELNGDAAKILSIKQSEALAERQRLMGEGISAMRRALGEATFGHLLNTEGTDISPSNLRILMLVLQFCETLSSERKQQRIVMPYGITGMQTMRKHLMSTAMMTPMDNTHQRQVRQRHNGVKQSRPPPSQIMHQEQLQSQQETTSPRTGSTISVFDIMLQSATPDSVPKDHGQFDPESGSNFITSDDGTIEVELQPDLTSFLSQPDMMAFGEGNSPTNPFAGGLTPVVSLESSYFGTPPITPEHNFPAQHMPQPTSPFYKA